MNNELKPFNIRKEFADTSLLPDDFDKKIA